MNKLSAALVALKNLLQPNGQEIVLDATFDLNNGHLQFAMHPFGDENQEVLNDEKHQEHQRLKLKLDANLNVSEKKTLDELTDDEYIKQDLVKGLLRMNLMARFFYLLNAYNTSNSHIYDTMVKHILLILCRILRHSPQMAHELVDKYSQLLDLIVNICITSNTKFPLGKNDSELNESDGYDQNNESVHSITLQNISLALKLLRLIASSSGSLAKVIYDRYDLKNNLLNYLSISSPFLSTKEDRTGKLIILINFLF